LYLAEFISAERERVVLATKYTGAMRGRDINAAGNSRRT
jgi:aryl-alcohol dehydrogenase-like predicted oxidoreductase